MNWLHWSLLAALFAVLTAILAKVGITGVDSNLATTVRTTVISLFTWAIAFATTQPAVILDFSGRTWLFLTLPGVATGLWWLCYFRALQQGEASRVAPVDALANAVNDPRRENPLDRIGQWKYRLGDRTQSMTK